jgi:hypothetical protein
VSDLRVIAVSFAASGPEIADALAAAPTLTRARELAANAVAGRECGLSEACNPTARSTYPCSCRDTADAALRALGLLPSTKEVSP